MQKVLWSAQGYGLLSALLIGSLIRNPSFSLVISPPPLPFISPPKALWKLNKPRAWKQKLSYGPLNPPSPSPRVPGASFFQVWINNQYQYTINQLINIVSFSFSSTGKQRNTSNLTPWSVIIMVISISLKRLRHWSTIHRFNQSVSSTSQILDSWSYRLSSGLRGEDIRGHFKPWYSCYGNKIIINHKWLFFCSHFYY